MSKLLKQCFKTFLSKPGFLFTIAISFFAITFISSASLTLLSSISTSINDINQKSKVAELTINNLNNLKSTILIPDFDSNIIGKKNYQPKIVKTVAIDMNQLDIDNWSNYILTDEQKFNFLRFFPFKRSQLLPHAIKNKFSLNPDNNKDYVNVPGELMQIVGNPLLNIPLSLNNAAYGYSFSFFDPFTNKLLSDPRNFLFKYDEEKQEVTSLGLYNNGNIQNKIEISTQYTAYKNPQANGDVIFDNGNVSPNALYRDQPNSLIANTYNINNKQLQMNDIFSDESVVINDVNYNLIKNARYGFSHSVQFFLNSLSIFNTPPQDKYQPYLRVQDGYQFNFVLSNNKDETDLKFKTFLITNDPDNRLLQPLVLDEFNLFGMSKSKYDKLDEKSKQNINNKIKSSIRQYANKLSQDWNEQKHNWIISELTTYLNSNSNINWTVENEYYYQSEDNQELLFVSKDNKNVNKLVMVNGVDLPYQQSQNKLANFLNKKNKPLSLDDVKDFLTYISTFTLGNKNKTEKFIKNTQNCINLIETKKTKTIDEFAMTGDWKEWVYRYGCNLLLNNNDPFSTTFTFKENEGFTSLWLSQTFKKVNITNYFVVVSDSYFVENKKKYLPTSSNTKISLNGNNDFPLYSMNDILSGNVDPNYFDLNNPNTYLNQIPAEYKINFFNHQFLIIGSGVSADYAYPIVSIQSPIPNPKKQGIIYTTQSLYNAILKFNNLPETISNISIHVKSGDYNNVINNIKLFAKEKFNNENIFNLVNTSNSNDLNSLRYSLPQIIQKIIVFGSIFISLLLFIILLYASFMLINIIIDKLNKIIAICRAQGFSNTKIAFIIALPLVLLVGIVGALAYLLTFFLTPYVLGIFSNLWFLPLLNSNFVWYILLGSVAIPMIIATVIVFSLVYIKFRKPILDNLNDVDNVKSSGLSNVCRSNNLKIRPIWKYRISLFLSRSSKLFILMLLMSFTFGFCIASLTTNLNSRYAVTLNNNAKKYTYSLDLISPQENTGLYKQTKYDEVGVTDIDKGIDIANVYLTPNDPYGALMQKQYLVENNGQQIWLDETQLNGQEAIDIKVTPSDLFALRDNQGNIIDADPNVTGLQKQYYTNTILPSYNVFNLINQSSNLLFDSVFSIFLLDINVNSLGNIWIDYVKPLLPQKISYQMENNLTSLKKLIVQEYGSEFEKFIKKDKNGKYDINNFEIDASTTIHSDNNYYKIRYNDNYLMFLGKLFANKKIINNDIKLMTGSVIPVDNDMNSNNGFDETYTWATSSYIKVGDQNFNNKIKLIGIKNNSNFIKLYNESNNYIDLSSLKENEVVINTGAGLKYGLSKGDEFTISIDNDYFNSSRKIINYLYNDFDNRSHSLTLKVKDVSNDPIGETFYSSQNNVNNWTNLNKGDFISSMYMNHYMPNINSKIETISLADYQKNNPSYVPFNGVFTNKESLDIGNKAILLTSNTGFYSSYFKISEANPLSYFDPTTFSSFFATRSNKEIYDFLKVNNYDELISIIEKTFTNSGIVREWLKYEYNDIQMLTNLSNVNSIELTDELFIITNQFINIINLLVLSIFLPTLIATTIICIMGIIDSTKKQIGVLRLLGYTSSKITRTILYIFLPTIALAGCLGLGVLFAILYLCRSILFNLTSIFVAASINGWILGIGFAILVLLLIFVSTICYLILKRNKYSQIIKSSYY